MAEITARGITPAACEMLDGWTIRAVEDYVHAGFPLDAAAVLLIDVDGLREVTEAEAAEVANVCRLHRAREVRVARDAHERELLWKGRKNAFGAAGRFSPSYYTQDGVIPRTKLPATLRQIRDRPKIRPADRECISRGRRQPASNDSFRRAQRKTISRHSPRRR